MSQNAIDLSVVGLAVFMLVALSQVCAWCARGWRARVLPEHADIVDRMLCGDRAKFAGWLVLSVGRWALLFFAFSTCVAEVMQYIVLGVW